MPSIVSHTLVKNGMPFIIAVLEKVEPFVDRQIITMSKQADVKTYEAIKYYEYFHKKVVVLLEDVKSPEDLTIERQKQLDMTTEDWVLFLDDDDFWPEKSLKDIKKLIKRDENVDAYCFRPFQVINKTYHDGDWWNKWFTKLFRNQPGVHYERPWPRDLIFKGSEALYWKTNPRVVKKEIPFFHLSYIKDGSFREKPWAKEFKYRVGDKVKHINKYKIDIKEIYGHIRKDK